MWLELIKYLGGSAVTLAAVAWLCQALVKHWLSIASKNAVETVRHEMERQLEVIHHKHQIDLERQKSRYARLQDERIPPLLHLYSEVVKLTSGAFRIEYILEYCTIDADVEIDIRELRDHVSQAKEALAHVMLFLPSTVANSISELISTINQAETNYYVTTTQGGNGNATALCALRDELNLDYETIERDIANQFREILGVEGSDASPS